MNILFSVIHSNDYRGTNEAPNPHSIHMVNINIGQEDERSSHQTSYEDGDDDMESGR